MRIAVVSDIHGNLTALDAIIADLEQVRPDVVVQGGDLALGGPQPAEVVERVRELGWPSVLGNCDEALDESKVPERARKFMGLTGAHTAEMLDPEQVAWLLSLPLVWKGDGIAVVHALPGDCWAIVEHNDPDERLREAYGQLGVPVAVYGHIHHAYVRRVNGLTVVNCGSVSLALDGDIRAAYAVIEDGEVEIRRVPYDVERVAADLVAIEYPNVQTYVTWLRTGRV
jgi:putative phosphoesterase